MNIAVLESFEELNLWLPWAEKRPSLDESESSARQAHADWLMRKDIRLLLWDRTSAELVGCSGLHHINWSAKTFEIGYWMRTAYQGQGFMMEAVAAITQFAFGALGARRIQIRCDSDNVRSRNIPQRLGFEYEGLRRKDDLKPRSGESRDTMVFARTSAGGLPDVGANWEGVV